MITRATFAYPVARLELGDDSPCDGAWSLPPDAQAPSQIAAGVRPNMSSSWAQSVASRALLVM